MGYGNYALSRLASEAFLSQLPGLGCVERAGVYGSTSREALDGWAPPPS